MADSASQHSGVSVASRATSSGTAATSTYMSEEEQDARRQQIKGIMQDKTLSQVEKSRSIQSLMDGRSIATSSRRSSVMSATASLCSSSGGDNNGHSHHTTAYGSPRSHYSRQSSHSTTGPNVVTPAAAAASIASGHASDEDGDTVMTEAGADGDGDGCAPNDIYGYGDLRSVASSISYTSRSVASSGEANILQEPHHQQQQQQFPPGTYRQLHGRSYSLQEWGTNDFGVTTAAGVGGPMDIASLQQQHPPGTINNTTALAFAAANTNIFDGQQHGDNSRWMEQSRPPCDHYARNCTLVAPCCGLAFGCRICHDDCPVLPPPIKYRSIGMMQCMPVGSDHKQNKKKPPSRGDDYPDDADDTQHAFHGSGEFDDDDSDEMYLQEQQRQMKLQHQQGQQHNVLWWAEKMATKQKQERRRSMPLALDYDNAGAAGAALGDEEYHHQIDRFAIDEIICRKCYKRQSSKTNKCNSCGIQFGDYHCSICNLWMSNDEHPYHCLACGFCRVGGRENFKHCDDCGMCIDALLFDNHNCKAGKYDANCPVCQEDLFSSRQASHEMPCGHAIHWHCFKELTSFDTRCPVCKKTAETPEQMASTWSAIAMGIALQPVPPDLARLVNIVCNDCEERDCERRWHFLGVRCMHCLSFNTAVEQILLQGREAAEYLDEQEAQRSGAHGIPTNIATLSIRAPQQELQQQAQQPAAAAAAPAPAAAAAAAAESMHTDEEQQQQMDNANQDSFRDMEDF